MVQSASRVRLPDARGGHARHFRSHGNAATLRHDRITARPVRAGALWAGPEGLDGGRGPSGKWTGWTGIALASLRCFSTDKLKRKRRWVAVFLNACCTILAIALTPARAAGQDTIDIVTRTGVHAISVELATNTADRALGLMFRKELPEGHGMLFDFQTEQQVQFWMHNTYVPLDMIFIAADGRIVHIAENAKPMSDDLVPSVRPVRAVLEVIAGTGRKFGIAPGDRVTGSIFGKGGGH